MALSLNEIKTRAAQFVLNWKEKAPKAREEADAQTFENEFFHIFDIPRNKIAVFEHRVKLQDGSNGYIDLLWKGFILIEMKSPGKDLQKAYEQAKNYTLALNSADIPKGILICDFVHFHYYNLERNGEKTSFTLGELTQYTELFLFLAGYKDVEYKKQDAVNIQAAEKMGALHDCLKAIGYEGHPLEVYLVRLLFCLFADDTGIFEHDHFVKYILLKTNPDGSDLAMHLSVIFQTLNTPKEKRLKNIDEMLNAFPYINGKLFEEPLPPASFDSAMREKLIDCCKLDWSGISPAIFGAMFQSVMNPNERHALGAHYTSEENILKVIHPLFLDELWAEFEKYRLQVSAVRTANLNKLHEKIAGLTFLDPACGCGNFLVIAYRELRLLELAIIQELLKAGEQLLDISLFIKVNVDQFYGIEIEEFPAQIAQVALWLMDHQMNMKVRDSFGQYFVRIPLTARPNILNANALTFDWQKIIPKHKLAYILGNPPFLGQSLQSKTQKSEMEQIFKNVKNAGNLDFVTAWYKKACNYIQDTNIECAFVSTNSICQGQQVPILWQDLFAHGIKINFAHQTFKWSNEARGNAAVYCIIVGFALKEQQDKRLFVYDDIKSDPKEQAVKRLNAYLIDAENIFIENRSTPLDSVPEISMGNKIVDGGNYLFSEEEKDSFLQIEPNAGKYFKRWIGSNEFINNKVRYCLWLGDCPPNELSKMPHALKRSENVRKFRLASKKTATKKLSETPTRFECENMPNGTYIAIPETSSENRKYIPIGFLDSSVLCSNAMRLIPNATLYEFGILTSAMHMAWTRAVCGRLEMRYRYSAQVVYNNFPWVKLEKNAEKEQYTIEEKAQAILDCRKKYPESSLADLYNPETMPPDLVKAHHNLDKAVDKLYRKTPFADDTERVAFLFDLYRQKTADLFAEEKKQAGKEVGGW